jgi:hypothetical protein
MKGILNKNNNYLVKETKTKNIMNTFRKDISDCTINRSFTTFNND